MQSNWKEQFQSTWKPLNLLNLYRLTLSGLFVTLAVTHRHASPLGDSQPGVFIAVATVYLLLSLAFGLGIRLQKPAFPIQMHLHIFTDIAALVLLMHASGGSSSGVGMLLILPVAAGTIFTDQKQFALFPSVASLFVLVEQFYIYINGQSNSTSAHAAILGVSLFGVSLITHVLVTRIRTSEALAKQQGIDLANLAQLNEQIVQHMRSGVMVVDPTERIHLMNQAAWYMLGLPNTGLKPALKSISIELSKQLKIWQMESNQEQPGFFAKQGFPQLVARFNPLGVDAGKTGTLIFLEDATAIAQQAQQMKLASLGRLTANIAHEIRNPLAAISHAGQLLAESKQLKETDLRLTQIISDHSQRINTIIENIMQLSRKDRIFPVETPMREWLEEFKEEFCLQNEIQLDDVIVEVSDDISIKFDQMQFQQVLRNLCHNALKHSENFPGKPKIILICGKNSGNNQFYLDVIDQGAGADEETMEQLFEPFFTTDSKSNGLGLFIARELLHVNRAKIEYRSRPGHGGCFRISFLASPLRVA